MKGRRESSVSCSALTMSSKTNSSKNSLNSFVQISDTMMTVRADIERAAAQDIPLLKPSIDLSKLSLKVVKQMPDFKKLAKTQSIGSEDIETIMNEINQQLEGLDQLKAKSVEVNDHKSTLDTIDKSIDQLTKCLPTFKRMVNTFTEKSKNNNIRGKQNFERKSFEIDDQKAEQMVKSAQQLRRLQRSNRFVKSISDN